MSVSIPFVSIAALQLTLLEVLLIVLATTVARSLSQSENNLK